MCCGNGHNSIIGDLLSQQLRRFLSSSQQPSTRLQACTTHLLTQIKYQGMVMQANKAFEAVLQELWKAVVHVSLVVMEAQTNLSCRLCAAAGLSYVLALELRV